MVYKVKPSFDAFEVAGSSTVRRFGGLAGRVGFQNLSRQSLWLGVRLLLHD